MIRIGNGVACCRSLIGSPIILDASLFKLEPPPFGTAAFC